MRPILLPQDNDWNRFWLQQKQSESPEISWSKRRIIKVLDPLLGSGKKALDAGCGSGFFAQYFLKQGMKVTAIDYSAAALALTRAVTQNQAVVLKRNLLSAALGEEMREEFDVIFSDGLLEHFLKEDQDKIMKNFYRMLKPAGVLALFVPNRFSPWELLRPFFMPGIEETPFVLSGLVRLNERNNFHVLKKGGVNTFPWAISPDKSFGRYFGMLLYVLARKDV